MIADQNTLLNYAFSIHQSGNVNDAIPLYQQLHAQFPDNSEILTLLGTAWLQLENISEGTRVLEHSLKIFPDQPIALSNIGNAFHKLKKFDESIVFFDRAIALNPDFADAYFNRGNILKEIKQYDEALENYNKSISLEPNFANVYNNKGNILNSLKRFDEALLSYEQAIALNPNFAEAYCNHGGVLKELKRFDEALSSCNLAIALNPNFAEAYCNRGSILTETNRLDEAIASYEQAITLVCSSFDDLSEARWNKALLKLIFGDYEEGWELYEWRWKSVQKEYIRSYVEPLWLGDVSLSGKIILIYAEQGFGDVIQMCRYLPMFKALGANVILEVRSQLISLLSTLKSDIMFVETGKPIPSFDLQCPIMSFPLAFKTTLDCIPADMPYLFVDAVQQKVWKKKLGQKIRPRIGFVCSGSAMHKDDSKRSIQFALLKPLLNLPFEFHLLQKEIRAEDAAVLTEFPDVQTHHENLSDFSDTAALINEMDLVITVDTSVAHLAGALGKSVWVLISWVPDFRWLLDRSDSPWYPTATLFRQPERGNWEAVIEDVCQKLQEGVFK